MLHDFFFRLRAIFLRSSMERELDDEVRFHLDRQMETYVGSGMSRKEAERRARREFGAVALAKEDAREARGVSLLDTIWRDLRYGVRVLLKSPGFTLVATASLALGIGANTAIFTLLDAIRLRSLPLKAPEELTLVRVTDMSGARGSVNRDDTLTYGIWEQIRDRQQALAGVFAWSHAWLNLAREGEVRMEPGLWVTGSFFPGLGIEPAAGRLFGTADDHRGCGTPGVVVSYPFWKNELGGDGSAIGRRLTLNGHSVEVIGVTPAGFFGLEVGRSFSVVLPVCSQPAIGAYNALDSGTQWWLTVMGRLKPGWNTERAAAHFKTISAGIFEASLPATYPRVSVSNYLGMKLTAEPAGAGVSGLRIGYTDPLHILLGIAGFVLLIACANLANLMLARASVRAREIAVRLAIGASRGRLIAQLMMENLLIAAAGAGLGLALAHALSRLLVTQLTTDPKTVYLDLRADWRVLAFTAGLALTTCLLFGLAPALRATGTGPGTVLKQFGRGLAGSHERFPVRRMLASAQVALSLVLLVGALLFTGSLRNLLRVETGFQTGSMLIADLGYTRAAPLKTPVLEYQRVLLERVAAVPGVASVADTTVLPLSGKSWGNHTWADGSEFAQGVDSSGSRVSPGYFRTLGVRLIAGRDFSHGDTPKSPNVAIVNREFARRVMKMEAPIGRRFWTEATPSSPEIVYEIVGVVGDTKYRNLREAKRSMFYLPLAQDPSPELGDQLLIRCALPTAKVAPGVRRAITEMDPGARFSFGEMQELVDGSVVRERLMATLSTAFGILAGVLAAIGLYGVMAYTVTRRTNEIGIRMALGATPGEILRMVIGESGRVVALGLAAGGALSLWVAGFARKLLFGIEPGDAGTLVTAAAVLCAVALTAAWIPARRAARLDPTIALREE
jgi:putative ABC transport system permease protein